METQTPTSLKATATLNCVDQLDATLLTLLRATKAINKTNIAPQKETALALQKTQTQKFKSLQFNVESLMEDILGYQTKLLARFKRPSVHAEESLKISSNLIYCSQVFERKKTDEFKLQYHKNYTLLETELSNAKNEFIATYAPIIDFWYQKCRLNKLSIDKGPTESLKSIESSLDQLKLAYCTKPHTYKILGKRESMEASSLFDPEVYEDKNLLEDGIRDLVEFTRRFKKNAVDGLVFENTEKYLAGRRKKERKEVDRRATKGRKIKYEVHEKIVNFMVPVENENLLYNRDVVIGQMFGGKKKGIVVDKGDVRQDLDISLF